MARQLITEGALLQLVRNTMAPIKMDVACKDCVLRSVRRRVGGAPNDSNWIPGDAAVGSPDCERALRALLGQLMAQYNVMFKPT